MIIAHCPGHGIMKGKTLDKGCQHNGIVESDMTLAIPRDITRNVVMKRCHHLMLRDDERGDTYEARAIRAQELRADLVICHHVNAFSKPSAHGLLVFYQHDDLIGEQVAEMIERAAPYSLIRPGNDDDIPARHDDWTRNANWVMDHYCRRNIPTALIEWGFATNPDDAEYLLSEKSRPAMAACVIAGVARFLEIKK